MTAVDLNSVSPELPLIPDPPYDHSINYSQECWLLLLSNDVLSHQITHLVSENKRLRTLLDRQERNIRDRMMKIEAGEEPESPETLDEKKRKKHHRRTAAEVPRLFKCTYHRCEKEYGSEGSLKLHIKRKHGGDNKLETDKAAKAIALAMASGFQ